MVIDMLRTPSVVSGIKYEKLRGFVADQCEQFVALVLIFNSVKVDPSLE